MNATTRTVYGAGITAPPGWDTTYRTALRDVATAPVRVAVIGDSFVQGQNATNFGADGYAAVVRDSLTARHGYGGDGRIPQDNIRLVSIYQGTPPFVLAAGASYSNGYGLGHMPFWTAGAPNPAITFTSEYACTDIDIVYSHRTAGTWAYSVDGGADVTVTTTGNTLVGVLGKVQITGLANTTHTVVCKGGSANAAMGIVAICTYKTRASGIQFMRYGVSGQQLASLTTESVKGWGGMSGGEAGEWNTLGFPTAPHLAILAWGLNDCSFQTFTTVNSSAVATFGYALQKLIGALRRANNASIVLVVNANPDGIVSDANAYFGNENRWPEFMSAMHDTAEKFNCAVVNLHHRWRDLALTSGYTTLTNGHPTTAGHADIASALLDLAR